MAKVELTRQDLIDWCVNNQLNDIETEFSYGDAVYYYIAQVFEKNGFRPYSKWMNHELIREYNEYNDGDEVVLIGYDELHYLDRLDITMDDDCVHIFIDNGDDQRPLTICYWTTGEIEEDITCATAVIQAINLFNNDKEMLLETLGKDCKPFAISYVDSRDETWEYFNSYDECMRVFESIKEIYNDIHIYAFNYTGFEIGYEVIDSYLVED